MVGISTSYFAAKGLSIYESVKRVYELGFGLIELGANHDFEEDVNKTLKKLRLDFPDVIFTQHCYFPPVFKEEFFSNPAEGLTPSNKKVLETMFKTAQILGSKIISFHNGFNNKYIYEGRSHEFGGFKKFTPTEEIPSDLALAGLREFAQFALKKARYQGISVAIENVVASTFGTQCTLDGFVDFKKFLNDFPGLTFLFDFGHAFIEYQDPFQFFELGPKIVEMHLDDVTPENLDHRPLGSGILDLERLFSQIRKLPKLPLLVLEHSAEVKKEEVLKEKRMIAKLLEIVG